MASENDRHEAYKNYIAANESTVLKGLENWLLFGKPIAEASILYEIRKCLDPWPTHFILENSQSRKVRDGVLLENGYICKNLTIKVFLCEGENGHDEYYTTYGEELDISIGSVMEKMAKKGMEAILKDKFKSYENLQDEGVFMEYLFKVVDIYSALSVIRFYRMEGIALKDIR